MYDLSLNTDDFLFMASGNLKADKHLNNDILGPRVEFKRHSLEGKNRKLKEMSFLYSVGDKILDKPKYYNFIGKEGLSYSTKILTYTTEWVP